MELLNKIHDLVVKKFSELETYTTTYNTVVSDKRSKLIKDNKEKFKKDASAVDLEGIAKNLFYLNGFHQVDIRHLQTSFLSAYNLYLELGGDVAFEETLKTSALFLKENLPKQMFITKDGGFTEIVDGAVEKAMSDFDKNKYFKLFESQIIKLFNE